MIKFNKGKGLIDRATVDLKSVLINLTYDCLQKKISRLYVRGERDAV